MVRQAVVSTSLVSVGYSSALEVLEVEFSNGRIYQYVGVSPLEHRELMGAASKGQHFNRRIRGQFGYAQVAVLSS